MTTAQLGALIKGIAPAIRDAIAAATVALDARLAAVEGREPAPTKDWAPDLAVLRERMEVLESRAPLAGPPGPPGTPGRDGAGFDKGVWVAGVGYEQGDAVSYDGSLWIAQAATGRQPGTSKDWRLAVKHGRDGRNGKDGVGTQGPPGPPGRDLTQLGANGGKW